MKKRRSFHFFNKIENVDRSRQGGHHTLMRFKPITIAIILLCLAAGCIAASTAQSQESEYMIKAAFLYNFAKFVDWPDGSFMDDLSPIRLFIIGADPFGDTLDSLKD